MDGEFKTSAPGVWAVGEVTGPKVPRIQTVLGHAPVAALSIANALKDGKALAKALEVMRGAARLTVGLLQPQDVLHRVEARLLADGPNGGAQGARGEGVAGGRLVGQLDALPGPGEDDGVVADHIAAPQGVHPDLVPGPLARLAAAAVADELGIGAALDLAEDLGEALRGAAGASSLSRWCISITSWS